MSRRKSGGDPQPGRAHYEWEVTKWASTHYEYLWGRDPARPGQPFTSAQREARRLTKSDAEFRFWYRALEQQRRYERLGMADMRAGGILATALERFGYRRAGAWYAVGETDKIRKRQ